jgi:hypothetical protein
VHPLPEGRQDHEGRLTTLLEGAIAHLERNRARVNELNVFPVADGDEVDVTPGAPPPWWWLIAAD